LVRTFLLADVRGYTRYTAEHGDDAAAALARRLAALVGSTVAGFGGELIEVRGDETLCVFSSARQALRAAVEVQRRLRAGEEGEPFPLGVGMGLDAGEATPTDGGYRGAALNMAGRLVATAEPGEVLATERLVRLSGPIDGLHWSRPRSMRLKGLADPELVVRVEPDEPLPPPPPAPPNMPARGRPRRRALVALAVALSALVVGAVAVVANRGQTNTAETSVVVRAPSVAVVDPGSGQVIADLRLPTQPESLTEGHGRLWIGSSNQTVTPVSESDRRVEQPIGLGIDPSHLAFGDDTVWAFDGYSRVQAIDAQRRYTVGEPHRLWRCVLEAFQYEPPCYAGGIAVVNHDLWVSNATGSEAELGRVDMFDANHLNEVGVIHRVDVGEMVQGQGAVWVWGDNGRTVDQISPKEVRATEHTQLGVVASSSGGGITTGFGGAWVAAPASGNLFGIAAGQGTVTHNYRLTPGLSGIAASSTDVWVGVNPGRILRVHPFTGHFHSYPLAHDPVAMVYSNGLIWVAIASH
jgi:class 3 adenylate cyclase